MRVVHDRDCPRCGWPVEIEATASFPQHVQCADCRTWYSVDVDGDYDMERDTWRALYTLTKLEPPDWREVEGCERFHRNR